MREIKFRGRSLYDEKQWAYGLVFKSGSEGQWTEIQADNGATCYVDPETIGQYTGLKDKNGVEIYEGDIITWQDKPIFSDSEKSEKLKDIIVFEDGCFKTKTYNELLSNLARIEKTGFKFNYLTHHETEIIGNIYENPELLG